MEYRWKYQHEGNLFDHVRVDSPSGQKSMYWEPRLRDFGLSPIELPLYNASALKDIDPGSTVMLTEGEKAADALIKRGLIAVGTGTGAATIPADSVLAILLGLDVVLWPDNDAPGNKHMATIAVRLTEMGCGSVRVIAWDGAPSKGDAADFTGGDDELAKLIDDAKSHIARSRDLQTLEFLTGTQIREMTAEQVPWVVQGIAAASGITEISAVSKVGKTTFIAGIVKSVSTGSPFLGRETRMGPVVYLTEERSATFRATLERADLIDSNSIRVLLHQMARSISWPDVVTAAVAEASRIGAVMLIVDTLPVWANLAGDTENEAGVALESMLPLQDAAATGLAVVVIRHDRKGGGDLGESGRGSSAFAGASDILLNLKKANTPGHPTRRMLTGVGRFDGVPDSVLLEMRDSTWTALGSSTDVERSDTKSRLLGFLPGPDEPWATIEQILEFLGPRASRTTVNRALDELIQERLVEKGERTAGPNGQSHGYRSVDDKPPSILDERYRPPVNGGDQGVPLKGVTPQFTSTVDASESRGATPPVSHSGQ